MKTEGNMFFNDNLYLRRQFILGPNYIEKLSKWGKKRISDNLFLTVHPDLKLNCISNNNISLTLLGFMFDYHNPDYSNSDILRELISSSNTFKDIIRGTYSVGGRWILIYKNNKCIKMFHDLMGSRQIFYCKNDAEIWCASQPHTIAGELNLQKSKNTYINDYFKKNMFIGGEASWPGDGTIYDDIKHLLPNHYLDLINGLSIRYWPDKKLDNLSLSSAVSLGSEILKGIMKSANNRYNLIQAVSAGWDSRVLLSASREERDDIFYYIQKFSKLTNKSTDIKIPIKLFSKLGIRFNVIECDNEIEKKLEFFLKKNINILHNNSKKVLYNNFYKNFQGKLNISGYAGEIGRRRYRAKGLITAEKLAGIFAQKGSKFAIKEFKKWLNETQDIANKFEINLLDLFYWEQKMGNWGAMFPAELDIAIEEFYPFNQRKLIETLLSVDEKYRKYFNPILYKELIKNMWPEVLKVPINPGVKTKKIIKITLKKIYCYHLVKYLYKLLNLNK